MVLKNTFLSLAAVSFFVGAANAGDCFDRTLAISRYHYVNPGSVASNWQEIYEISLAAGNVSVVTRLTKGAIASSRYDSSFQSYSPDGTRIAFIESDAGGANARLKVMDAVDSNSDLEGDNAVVLDAADVDINNVVWGQNNRLVYGKFDGLGDTQIASATLSGVSLGSITMHTTDTDYPDSYSFVADDQVIYDVDGRWLKHIDLSTNSITILSGPSPVDRSPTGHMIGADIYFSRIVASTFDLWTASIEAGPVLSATAAFLATTAYNEISPVVSDDGACLAFLAGDLAINYGPNSDLWIRDLATGQTQQITLTRDLAGVVWRP